MKRVFFSEQGLRSGWSLVIFFLCYAPLTLGTQFAFATVPVLRDWVAVQPHGVTPISQIEFTALEVAILLISVVVVRWIERRSWHDYGLETTARGFIRLLPGVMFGFGMASALIGMIALLGGFEISGVALHGHRMLSNGVLYGIGFFLIGFFEEFTFRGYLQATLQRGIGFWPAAIVLSLVFGAVHLPGMNGAWIGVFIIAGFGLWGAFSLRRTGSLWFVIGTHSALDWSIAFFYSAPLAGQSRDGHLLNVAVHGPEWLTGGGIGPVGSVCMFAVLALAALVIHLLFPKAGMLKK
jgi:membrane protease YdiL (CAAX protease family)